MAHGRGGGRGIKKKGRPAKNRKPDDQYRFEAALAATLSLNGIEHWVAYRAALRARDLRLGVKRTLPQAQLYPMRGKCSMLRGKSEEAKDLALIDAWLQTKVSFLYSDRKANTLLTMAYNAEVDWTPCNQWRIFARFWRDPRFEIRLSLTAGLGVFADHVMVGNEEDPQALAYGIADADLEKSNLCMTAECGAYQRVMRCKDL